MFQAAISPARIRPPVVLPQRPTLPDDADDADDEQRPIGPQSGPQERYLSSSADIAIYGGAAGAGKTYAALLEPLYHIHIAKFYAVIFRRLYTEITKPGSLWDESIGLYSRFNADSVKGNLQHTFPSGSRVEFHHINAETDVKSWQGAQVPLFEFEELTHFTKYQFFYIMSRNRSICGVRPYMRATCNPDADSWVAEFIAWWIDQDTGFPIPSRSGVLRWFIRVGDTLVWADTPDELIASNPKSRPKSVTFIGALIFDNPALLAKDPGYLANLEALPAVERARLLGGNWKIRKSSGMYFKRAWLGEPVSGMPVIGKIDFVRHWDLAATTEQEGTDPDWTVGTLVARVRLDDTLRYVVCDRIKFRGTPLEVERSILNTAQRDGRAVPISLPQDPGQAGKWQARRLIGLLSGWRVSAAPESGDKVTRFGAFSAQCEAGNVTVVRAGWNDDWFDSLEGFPEGAHDDDADSVAGAFNRLLAAPVVVYAGRITSAIDATQYGS